MIEIFGVGGSLPNCKVIEGNNRQVVENSLCYQENLYEIDFQNLEGKLAQKNNTILLLCSPHNPTGRV